MTCRVARSFPNQIAADSSEKGGRPVSDLSLPSVQSAITVLLIDAFKEDREYWAQRLHISSPKYVILEADTGASGLAVCQSQRVDCVVLEMNLPDMPGFELLIKLVQRPHHPEIAVIMLSRVDHLPVAQLAKDNGAQAFLVKSRASGDQLSRAIPRAIANTRQCIPNLIVGLSIAV
ncbi:MAG TPA: response regulator [Nitrospira sp.]|nr:response regulator [Nitrospira sp.]